MNEQTPRIVTLEDRTAAVIRGDQIPMSELSGFFDRAFQTLARVLDDQGVQPTTAAFARYFGAPTDTADLETGFGTSTPIEPGQGVVPTVVPGGRAAEVTHVGSYDGLGAAWQGLADWITAQGLQGADSNWEEYVTMPTPGGDTAALRTVLRWPLVD